MWIISINGNRRRVKNRREAFNELSHYSALKRLVRVMERDIEQ